MIWEVHKLSSISFKLDLDSAHFDKIFWKVNLDIVESSWLSLGLNLQVFNITTPLFVDFSLFLYFLLLMCLVFTFFTALSITVSFNIRARSRPLSYNPFPSSTGTLSRDHDYYADTDQEVNESGLKVLRTLGFWLPFLGDQVLSHVVILSVTYHFLVDIPILPLTNWTS